MTAGPSPGASHGTAGEQVLLFFLSMIAFLLISSASYAAGRWGKKWLGLPAITGNLIVGALGGPYVAGSVSIEQTAALLPVLKLSLAFIAMAAGAEMVLEELRPLLGTIGKYSALQVLSGLGLGTALVMALAPAFLPSLSVAQQLGVAVITSVIMCACSPSSAIAIVSEMRAKGPFTSACLGVTMMRDVVVIILFGIATEVGVLVFFPTGGGFNPMTILLLVGELAATLATGVALGKLLQVMCWIDGTGVREFVRHHMPGWVYKRYWKRFVSPYESAIRGVIVLFTGLGVFLGCSALEHNAGFKIEPLLALMAASAIVVNFTGESPVLIDTLHAVSIPSTLAFFTITGASMNLEVVIAVFPWACAIFAIRILTLLVGTWTGGWWAGEPLRKRNVAWATYITQAGVALALIEETKLELGHDAAVAHQIDDSHLTVLGVPWAEAWATAVIGSTVIAQLVGPVGFKIAINRSGEAGKALRNDKELAEQLKRCNTGGHQDLEELFDRTVLDDLEEGGRSPSPGTPDTVQSPTPLLHKTGSSSHPARSDSGVMSSNAHEAGDITPGMDARRWAAAATLKHASGHYHNAADSFGSTGSGGSVGSTRNPLSVFASIGSAQSHGRSHSSRNRAHKPSHLRHTFTTVSKHETNESKAATGEGKSTRDPSPVKDVE